MTTLEKIEEWEKGCSNTQYNGEAPEDCPECTRELITAIKYDKCRYDKCNFGYLAFSTSCGAIHNQALQGTFCPFCGREIDLYE